MGKIIAFLKYTQCFFENWNYETLKTTDILDFIKIDNSFFKRVLLSSIVIYVWLNFKDIMLSERSPSQRLHIVWFHLYDILELLMFPTVMSGKGVTVIRSLGRELELIFFPEYDAMFMNQHTSYNSQNSTHTKSQTGCRVILKIKNIPPKWLIK